MTVAFDAQSSLAAFTTSNTFTHTPVGTPKGICVMIAENIGVTDVITAVTYGGVALSRVNRTTDAVGEPGQAYLYFLGGGGIPTGAQTVAITVGSGTTAKCAWCVSMTANSPRVALVDNGVVNADIANPAVTLKTSADYKGFACAVLFSGANAPASITAGAGFTLLTTQVDFGNESAVAERSDTLTGANAVAAFVTVVDDVAMIAAAFAEPGFRPELAALQAVNRAATW